MNLYQNDHVTLPSQAVSDRPAAWAARFCTLPIAMALLLAATATAAASAPAAPPPPDPLVRKTPTWHLPPVSEVKLQAADWVRTTCKDHAAQTRSLAIIASLGDKSEGTEILDRLGEAFAAADPRMAQLVDLCSRPRSHAILPTFAWMTDGKAPAIVAANMRLYFGRWLVQGEWYEEGLEQIGSLKTSEVAAPAELLFFQSVAYDRLLNKEQGLKTLDTLLDGSDSAPRRYVAVATLMKADLSGLEEGTLDHIARMMEGNAEDLDKGRADKKTKKTEGRIIEGLDKIIKKMEAEQKKNSQNQSNSLRSSKPADASRPMGGKAPGDVDKKDVGHKSGWGDLPPKQREEALHEMERGLPPHYRDAIEQYLRKVTTEEGDAEDK